MKRISPGSTTSYSDWSPLWWENRNDKFPIGCTQCQRIGWSRPAIGIRCSIWDGRHRMRRFWPFPIECPDYVVCEMYWICHLHDDVCSDDYPFSAFEYFSAHLDHPKDKENKNENKKTSQQRHTDRTHRPISSIHCRTDVNNEWVPLNIKTIWLANSVDSIFVSHWPWQALSPAVRPAMPEIYFQHFQLNEVKISIFHPKTFYRVFHNLR